MCVYIQIQLLLIQNAFFHINKYMHRIQCIYIHIIYHIHIRRLFKKFPKENLHIIEKYDIEKYDTKKKSELLKVLLKFTSFGPLIERPSYACHQCTIEFAFSLSNGKFPRTRSKFKTLKHARMNMCSMRCSNRILGQMAHKSVYRLCKYVCVCVYCTYAG